MRTRTEGSSRQRLSGQLAGAGATKSLAAFGAEVIRVEDPTNLGKWDILRGAPTFKDEREGINLGSPFNNHNVEKLSRTQIDMYACVYYIYIHGSR